MISLIKIIGYNSNTRNTVNIKYVCKYNNNNSLYSNMKILFNMIVILTKLM